MSFFKSLFAKKTRTVDLTRRFELISRMGQGTMSKVWRARDKTSGQLVAIKVLDKEKTEQFEARFAGMNKPSEGEAAVQLRHPHIVRTFEHGLTRSREPFLVMEFLEGTGLNSLIESPSNWFRRERLRLITELGEAVAYCHQNNWIHRDLCPQNVVVDGRKRVKLIDFGLIVPNTPVFRKPGNRTGKTSYMAPELIRRQSTDQRIDIFSYSATCYETFTGQLPWERGESMQAIMRHINQPPKDIRDLVPDIAPPVAETIMRGLAPSPGDRWPSMEQMLAPLRRCRQSSA